MENTFPLLVTLCSHYGKQYAGSSKTKNQNFLMGLGRYLKEYVSGDSKATSAPMLIAALLTIASCGNNPDALQLMNG
jgi:hypothetical protein